MRKFTEEFENRIEDYYVGTNEEVLAKYKELTRKDGAFYFLGEPKLKPNTHYAVCVIEYSDDNGIYTGEHFTVGMCFAPARMLTND